MSKIAERLKRLVRGMEDRHAFKLEGAILKFTRLLRQNMERANIGPTELAKRIEAKPPYISKILRGESNFTLDSLIKLCTAVDADFVFDVLPKEKKKYVVVTVAGASISNYVISHNHTVFTGYQHNRASCASPTVKFADYDECLQ